MTDALPSQKYYKKIEPRDAWVLELRLHPAEGELNPSATTDSAAVSDRMESQ